MSKLRQVLKLWFQGHNKLQVTKLTGVARNTVKKYLSVVEALSTTWEELNRLSDKDLDDLFCKEPETVPDNRLNLLLAFFKEHDKRLRQRGMTLLRLWELYRREHPAGFGHTAFYRHYHLWKRRVQPSMHIEHTAGDKMYVDFTGEKLPVLDEATGELKQAEVFVAILGASQLTYMEAVLSQRVEDFIGCCEHALQYFGGSPNAIVPDNLKSAVVKSSRYEPTLNENFEAFADHYGMTALPARAYKPKDKSLVEGAVKIMYNRIFVALSERPAMPLEALNNQVLSLLELHNTTPFKGRSYSRREQFDELEKMALQPLPAKPYELRRSLHATVMKNGHVCLSVDKHYYSVPYGYISKKVRILFSVSEVEIFYKYERIATHRRVRSAHNYSTEASHMASQHQVQVAWNPDYFLSLARAIAPEVEQYISQVLLKKRHPEQAYKICNGILSFAKRIGHDRLIRACQRGHAYGLYSYRAIEDILQKGLDLTDPDDAQSIPMPSHDNIRGNHYYQ